MDITISNNTIRSRYRRFMKEGTTTCPVSIAHAGQSTVLKEAEEVLVAILTQMGRIRCPITVKGSINLMNSLIKGTEGQKRYIEFQKKHCGMTDENPALGRVGVSYFRLFCTRHKHRLVTRRGERFACYRDDWSKERFFFC